MNDTVGRGDAARNQRIVQVRALPEGIVSGIAGEAVGVKLIAAVLGDLVYHHSAGGDFRADAAGLIGGLLNDAIVLDPYNPALFARMAYRLAKVGKHAAREKYSKKAKHLYSVGISGTTYIDVAIQDLPLDSALHLANTLHQAEHLQEASRLYHAILLSHPRQPNASYNMGLLDMQSNQPTTALQHFKNAVESMPNEGQFWISYIDALIQTNNYDAAEQVLGQGRLLGLQGEAVDALVKRLNLPVY